MANNPKLVAVMWEGNIPAIERIKDRLPYDLELYSPEYCQNHGISSSELAERIHNADVGLVFCMSQFFFEDLGKALSPILDECRIIGIGTSSSLMLNNMDPEIADNVYRYMREKGDENFFRMFDYIGKTCLGIPGEILPILEMPKQSLVSPVDGSLVHSLDEYLERFYPDKGYGYVAILCSRTAYQQDELAPEREMCKIFEKHGMSPLLIYTGFSTRDGNNALDIHDTIDLYCRKDGKIIIDAVVKPSRASLNRSPLKENEKPLDWLCELDIPIFHPVMLSKMTVEDWEASDGINLDQNWQVHQPEFEGIIESIVIGSDLGRKRTDLRERVIIPERVNKLASRVRKYIALRKKDNSEKKVLIILNNFPCVGAESNIGNAVGLDTLNSTVELMKALKVAGYYVDPPENGNELLEQFLQKKAMSDFRWTSAADMIRCGGVVHQMDMTEYRRFFDSLSEKVCEDIIRTWGEPPGLAMAVDDKILITGLCFGNIVVATQPKRGCYGSRCDGEVCKILQDPRCPPTHQFLATYHFYEEIWGADAIVNMGTHGVLENLPGKSVGLSGDCYPDIAIGSVPHIYPFNSGSVSAGLGAKRRTYATLIDHIGPVMEGARLSGPMAELNTLLAQYNTVVESPERKENMKKLIIEKVREAGFTIHEDRDLEGCIREVKELLSRMTTTFVNRGLHILGAMPEDEDLVSLITTMVNYGTKTESLRGLLADLRGYSLETLLGDRSAYKELIDSIMADSRTFVSEVLDGKDPEVFLRKIPGIEIDTAQHIRIGSFSERIVRIADSVGRSTEIGSVVHALDGGFIPAGPSGSPTDGKDEVLPTGRNMHGMGSDVLPTRIAWETGRRLAELTVKNYHEEHGEYPQSIGLFWMLGEHLSSGGEQMSQTMYLLGAEPVWESNGKVVGFKIIPLEELGRPRIDITINLSSLLRDGLKESVDLIDSIVEAVSDLDEPLEMNFVRRHTLEAIKAGMSESDSKARMFGAAPGAAASAVGLAIYASAWKDKKDLVGFFLNSKGYAYGGKRNGEKSFGAFANALSHTEMTMHKSSSNDTDMLSGGRSFGNVGGLAASAEYFSKKKVEMYCSNTSDKADVRVETMARQLEMLVNTKLFNPEWIENMKKNGYRGASETAKKITTMFGWQATSDFVDSRIFDRVVETYVDNEDNREFLHKTNPYALEEIERRLLEANSRGMWNTSEDILDRLREDYLELEADLESMAGDGEFQGGNVDIITSDQVDSWKDNMSQATEFLEKYHDSTDNKEGSN